MRRPTWTEYFLTMADLASSRSTCLRQQHGAVLVKDSRVLATGYNGAVCGAEHCSDKGECERMRLGAKPGQNYELCVALHAEQNALLQAARSGSSAEGATLYVTGPPCKLCARMIVNAGVAQVVFQASDRYASEDTGLDILSQAGVRIYSKHPNSSERAQE